MSVLIRGMEIPKNCGECFVRYVDHCGYIRCGATQQLVKSGAKDRYDDCPLVEIPTPHGRLGDLDALQKQVENTIQDAHMSLLWKQGMMYAHGLVETSKTVIEAEGSEE